MLSTTTFLSRLLPPVGVNLCLPIVAIVPDGLPIVAIVPDGLPSVWEM